MLLSSLGGEAGRGELKKGGTNERGAFVRQRELYQEGQAELYVANSTSHFIF